ncbi:MAG: CsgG/HfaB family protein [Gemmatimonadota bacterium]
MRHYQTIISTLAFASLTACATVGMTAAESVTKLEQQQRSKPNDAAVNRSLGIAYFRTERLREARTSLETSQKLDPKDGTTLLYLGLTDEALGDLPAAKAAYSSYIQVGKTSRVRGQLQSRLAALARKEIAAEAKAAVAQESSIGSQPSNPRTVAVLPLRFSGTDSTLRPLERGFADLLTTDLARSSQLTLVERSRMQALLDEIKLQTSGATDATTNVRAGKLLRAGRLVSGTINQVGAENLRVDAAVVDVPTSQVGNPTTGSDVLDQVFNLEKTIALNLFNSLGVTLTVQERNLIEQRPTRSLQAFLAYSNGLVAEDQGRYDDAGRYFNEAVRIDPGFNAAQTKGQEIRAVNAGTNVTVTTVETSLKGTSEGAVVNAVARGEPAAANTPPVNVAAAAQATAESLNPSPTGTAAASGSTSSGGGGSAPGTKDPVSSGTGSDNPTGTAKVTIVIRRP